MTLKNSDILKNKKKSENIEPLQRACRILSELEKIKAREFCLCPGARNAPFVSLLSLPFFSHPPYHVFSCFEERSAAFFALGRIKKTSQPTVVVTTSGTAVAELLPAVVEAFYSKLPLILLTADRPRSYRGSGAPQSIEQIGIFSHYMTKSFDIDKSSSPLVLDKKHPQEPLHINVSLDEPYGSFSSLDITNTFERHFQPLFQSTTNQPPPLKKEPPSPFFSSPLKKAQALSSSLNRSDKNHPSPQKKHLTPSSPPPLFSFQKSWNAFFSSSQKPLVLLGSLPPLFRPFVKEFLKSHPGPIYAEPLSGLRESKILQPRLLLSGESVLKTQEIKLTFDSVLRIGGVPVLRFWRELENHILPVLNISHLPFKGLSRLKTAPLSLKDFCHTLQRSQKKESFLSQTSFKFQEPLLNKLFKKDRERQKKIYSSLKKYPLSELGMLYQLSLKVPEKSLIFLGNSLPIREWDLVASRETSFSYEGQRGVNGIDGLLSHFLGRVEKNKENWCFIGDLSTLYDLSALWLLKEVPKKRVRIVVINNQGGKIFSHLFKNSHPFENSHHLHFFHWAKMFGCKYIKLESEQDFKRKVRTQWPPLPLVIELKTHSEDTKKFWKAIKTL